MTTQDPSTSSQHAAGEQHLESLLQLQEALLATCQQTRRELAIFSPDLAASLYDRPEIEQAVSELARHHRRARVRLLVEDTRVLTEQGHRLVRLAQRLPTKIAIRKLTNPLESKANGFVLGDRHQLFYQSDIENHLGFRHADDRARVKKLRESFDRAWETAEEDQQLRRLLL